jgi:soluble lytic murein transglycosylase
MQYKKFLSRGFLKKSKTTLTSAFLLVALPGISEFGSYPVRDEAEHVQRAIQLIEERDLLVSPSDSIRLTSAGITRKTAQIHQFVIEYTERSLRGEWKAHAPKIARAILDSSTRHGFDPLLLLAVIQNESSFNPTVIGMHGEIGLMQLKPDTAEWVAKKSRIRWTGADMLRDPIANVRLGTAYLSMLKAKFGFEKDLYLAAYNMGVRNLNRLLSTNGYPQIYPQRTVQHYSRIYLEFLDGQVKKSETALAAI